MKESTYTMRRSSEDICRYQEDVRKHIYHLFANNYEELMNHLNYLLTSKPFGLAHLETSLSFTFCNFQMRMITYFWICPIALMPVVFKN